MSVTTTARTVPLDDILGRADVLPGQRDTPTRAERKALLRAMRCELDRWMPGFAHAAYKVPAALLDGRLTEAQLNAYPYGRYPKRQSRAIAHKAGMVFTGDAVDLGELIVVDSEDVGVAIEALRGLKTGDTGIHEGTWGFYAETLERHGLTVERAGELMRHYAGAGLTAAAQLLMTAHAVPLEDAQ